MPLTAQKLLKELQSHLDKHPEATDFLVKLEAPTRPGEEVLRACERVVLDLRAGSKHFLVE